MNVIILDTPTDNDWVIVRNAALNTIWKESSLPPSNEWKIKILASEHSPIRLLRYTFKFYDIPYWVANHLRTHLVASISPSDVDSYIRSQRNDRQESYDRNKAPQDAPVEYMISANAQGIIDVSKKRMCLSASLETRTAWYLLVNELEKVGDPLYQFCVPQCVYRNGICPEVFSNCTYNKSEPFRKNLSSYMGTFKVC